MDTSDYFPDWRTHDGFNFDPPGHPDAAQSIITSGNEQTADRSFCTQAFDLCDHLERATYSLNPFAAFDMRHHATPSTHQSFQQEHAPFSTLANPSIQQDIAMDIPLVQPYAGLNPVRDELEHYKEEIRTLYAENTLEAVRRTVNSKYHLKASSKMYKDRISKWGYKKNVKDAEKAAIVRKQIQRSYAGKGSEFELRNIHNLPAKLSRYRRKINLRTDQQALALRATMPPNLICRTPSPNPPLRMPGELESPELVVRAIQQYLCGMLDSRICRFNRGTLYLNDGKEKRSTLDLLSRFEETCQFAMYDLRRKDYTHALKWLNMSMGMAKTVIRSQEPSAFGAICSVLCEFWNSKTCRHIASTMMKQFAALSTVVLAWAHPLKVLFDNLAHTKGTTTGHNLALATKSAADMFTNKFGKFNRFSLSFQLQAADLIGDVSQRIESYSRLEREMRDTLGSNSPIYWDICVDLANDPIVAKEYQKAAELAETLMDHPAAANDPDYRCRALWLLARVQAKLCKTNLAEKHVCEAIRISAETRGWEDSQTLTYLSRLRLWLEEWGRAEDAALVRAYHENILDTMFDKLHLEEEERFQKHGITDASVS